MAKYTLEVPVDGVLHNRLKKRIENRLQLAKREQMTRHARWIQAEDRTLALLPEMDADRLRKKKREKGEVAYTTIQVPYTFALLMSAHTYWTSVFFARSPVHQFTGRHGEGEMQIQAMEALVGYQFDVANWLGPYYIWMYDGGKYGVGILGEYWDRRKLHYGQLVEMEDGTGKTTLMQSTQEFVGYTGNCLYNVSPWDWFPDPRKPVKEFQRGEFVGVRVRISWNDVLRRYDQGYYNENIHRLKDNYSGGRFKMEGSVNLEKPSFDSYIFDDFGENNLHPAGIVGYEFYVDLIPSEWGVGTTNFPQKWCITITEDYNLIIGASPLGHYHCEFPFSVVETEIEGYGTYTRGIPETMSGIQDTMDWLLNTHFYNVRSAINNQFIVDPSKLVIKDIQNSGPGFVWRLRPEAFGTDLNKMFMQVPIQDITRGHMTDFTAMYPIGERTLGINDQIMGSLGQGPKKTATEVRTTTGFGVNRLKTITEYMSGTAFSPHARRIVQNSQQFYDAPQKLRRVGNFALDAGSRFIMVNPDDIIGQFDFVPVDGVLPIDRMAQANLWKEIMGSLRMMPPQVAMSYDWSRIFAWVANLAGLKNVNQFKVQVVPDQMAQQGIESGNSIPLRPPNNNVVPFPQGGPSLAPVTPGNSASTAAGLNSLGGEAE